jgi:hypothetical protein
MLVLLTVWHYYPNFTTLLTILEDLRESSKQCGYEAWRLELPVRAYNQGPFYSDTGISVMLNGNICRTGIDGDVTAGGMGMAGSA